MVPYWCHLGLSWVPSGAFLDPPWPRLGFPGVVLGLSWTAVRFPSLQIILVVLFLVIPISLRDSVSVIHIHIYIRMHIHMHMHIHIHIHIVAILALARVSSLTECPNELLPPRDEASSGQVSSYSSSG